MTRDDENLARSAREALRRSETLDPVTRSRLAAARARALDVPRTNLWPWAGAAATLTALLLMAVWLPALDQGGAADGPDAEMLEMLASEAGAVDPALVEELDLLTWMDDAGESA